nr:outer membrane beta-barrel protein [Oscillatoria sp. FACHB-1406]
MPALRDTPDTEDRLQEFDRITALDPSASETALESPSLAPETESFPTAPKTLAASTPEIESFPTAPKTLAASTPPTELPRTAPRNQVAQRRNPNPSNLPAGIYGALSGDLRLLREAQLQGLAVSGIGTIGTGSTDFFAGFGINAAVGYKSLQNNLRVEAQLAYGQNEIGVVELPAIASRSISTTTVNGKGSISTFTGFLNGYYDLNTGSNWQPYIGGGIGLTRLASNGISATYPGTDLTTSVDDARWGFAYQIMAGTAYYLSPQTAVTLGYRYFDPLGGNTFDTPLGEVRLKDGGAHNFEFGVRHFF